MLNYKPGCMRVCVCCSSCYCSILCVLFLLQNLNWIHNPTTIVLYGNVDVVTVILAAVTPSTFVATCCSCFFLSDVGNSIMLDLLGVAGLLLAMLLLLGMLLLLLETLLVVVVVAVVVIVSGDMLLVLSISMGCSSSMSTYSMALSSSSCSSITENGERSKD